MCITHVIENPSGHAEGYNYSLVGAVSVSMLDEKPATRDDVMGGRARYAADGALVAWRGRQWRTVEQILTAAALLPEVEMCEAEGCACRKLFPAPELVKLVNSPLDRLRYHVSGAIKRGEKRAITEVK